MDGAPWLKPTAIIGNHACIELLACRCNRTHEHINLVGKAPCGRAWTAVASAYWPQFAAMIVKTWAHLLNVEQATRYVASAYRSGFALTAADSSEGMVDALASTDWAPSSKRARTTIAARIASGLQPRGRAIPQLIPDLLGPDTHLAVALKSNTQPSAHHHFSHRSRTHTPTNRRHRPIPTDSGWTC